MQATAGLATSDDWREALDKAMANTAVPEKGESWDLCLLFASDKYGVELADLVGETLQPEHY